MKIQIIAESEEEHRKFGDGTTFHDVEQFLMFGHDSTGETFHEWQGKFSFLLGQMHYFHELINDERREQGNFKGFNTNPLPAPTPFGHTAATPPGLVKRSNILGAEEVDTSNLQAQPDLKLAENSPTPIQDEDAFDEDDFEGDQVVELNAEDFTNKQ